MASNKNFLNINYQLSQKLKGKILIIGIGGGSDIVGAYALGKILQQNNPNARISVAVAVTPKSTYKGFDCIEENLYRANVREDVDLTKLHHTLSLIKQMSNFDSQFLPYVLERPKYKEGTDILDHQNEVSKAIKNSLNYLNPEFIIATDNGGDSLTGGISDAVEKEFDRTGIRALQEFKKPFDYMVFGPGCDGESTMEMIISSIERESKCFKGSFDITELAKIWSPISEKFLPKDRTPNVILSAFHFSEGTEIEIPRHRKPLIPTQWLKVGIVFDGLHFKG